MIWFDCKVVYYKEDDKGKRKRVTESYLVEAFNFSQAEDRISEQVAPFILGEFTVNGLRKASINEIFPNNEGDKLYKCKVSFMSIDEVSAKEKKINSIILVFGTDLANALEHLTDNLKECMDVYEVVSITETPYLDIFPLDVPADVKKKDETSSIKDEIAGIQDQLDEIVKLSDEAKSEIE